MSFTFSMIEEKNTSNKQTINNQFLAYIKEDNENILPYWLNNCSKSSFDGANQYEVVVATEKSINRS